MTRFYRLEGESQNAVFTFTISNGEAIMLPLVLSPRIHAKSLHVHTANFSVIKNVPTYSTISPTNPLIEVYRVEKLGFHGRIYLVFNHNQDRPFIGFRLFEH